MIKKRFLSMLVLLCLTVSGAWAQEERLLTTIVNTGDNASFKSGSKTFDNIATVTFSGEVYNHNDGWGWWSQAARTLTVTAAGGYTITRVKFYTLLNSAFDEEAPFEAILGYDDYDNIITKVNGTSIGQVGVTKIEVYGYGPYKVSLKEGTEDATSWQGKAGTGEYQALPLTGLEAGTAVSVKYNGRKLVKSVKAKKAAPAALNLTSPAVGQVIGDDGKNYNYASLPGGVTAVAKICYVSGSNGLALALTDEGQMNWSTAISTCAAHTPAFTGGTWKLATQDDWDNMINAAEGYAALRDGFSSVGGSNLQSAGYWSSTENGSDYAKFYHFDENSWYFDYKTCDYFWVRACLAFGAQEPDPIELTSTDGKTWTLASMSYYDVELEVTYSHNVSLKEGTLDATSWQGKAGDGEYQALPLEGVAAGTAVTVKYDGTKKVKSVKAKKKVKPAATVTTAPTAKTGVKAGQNEAIVNAGTAEGGTMMYMVNATQPASTDGFSATVPTAEGLTAGTYYVWYYVKGDASHTDSEISATGIEVTIAAAAPAYTMAAAATSADKGKLICADGHIHANGAEDAACTKARVAKIIYIGPTGHDTYTHGLALALDDEPHAMFHYTWWAATDACSAKNTSTPVTDATWLLASKDQWDYMLGANGAGSYTALRDGFSSVGGSNMDEGLYWSSTKHEGGYYDEAWCYVFQSGHWGYNQKKNYCQARACLAFGSAQDPDPIELTSTDGETWTLASMPDYDVELDIEYYPAYPVTINAGDAETANWSATPTKQSAGQNVTLQYTGKKKIKRITIVPNTLAEATAEDCGKVVCAAGHLHPAKTAVPSGCTAVGILGKVTEKGHGLILALQNGPWQSWNTINGWTSVTTYAGTTLKLVDDGQYGTTLTSYTTLGSTAVSNWCVAQKSDYEAIFANLGSTTSDIDGKSYDDNVNAYITTGVGGTALSGEYWCATEATLEWGWYFYSGFWSAMGKQYYKGEQIRPVLGF